MIGELVAEIKNKSSSKLLGLLKIILVAILAFGPINLVQADGDETLNTSFQTFGHYGLVSEGVGLRAGGPYDIQLQVPGTVVQAWLYWGGYDRIPGGDSTAAISVDGGGYEIVEGDLINDPNNCWWWGPFYGFVYRADVTSLVESGAHTYSITGIEYRGSAAVLHGASLFVVYEDLTLPLQEIEIKDGYDGMWDAYEPPRGPNSEVVTFYFDSQPVERNFDFTFIIGGVNTNSDEGIRTNALWYSFGFGSDTPPTNLVDEAWATDYMGSSTNPPASFDINPAFDADGKEWDNTTISVTVPANATFMCVQFEPEPSWAVDDQKYRAASMLFFGSAQAMAGLGRIGDFVWKDVNGDGNQDEGEPGLDGVTLFITNENGDTLATVVTGDNPDTPETEQGWYNFTDLEFGTYDVHVNYSTVSEGYVLTGGTLPDSIALVVGEDYEIADYGFQPPLFDFGDANDTPYPSLKANNGARHGQGTFYFGTGVTYEEESNQPDTDQMDDGIVLLGSSSTSEGPYDLPCAPGKYAAVEVTAGGAAQEQVYVHGWIDWNQDGDWADAGEKVFSSVPFQIPHVDTIEFTVPEQVFPGSLWARFRIDDQNLDEAVGEAAHGEVEDYFWEDALVAVELNSFQAIAGVGRVTLEWVTQSETENLGFNVYRANSGSDVFVKINKELISGQGTCEMATRYSYVDRTVEPKAQYSYKISDLNYQGIETMHGPITVSAVAPPDDYRLEQNYPNPFNPETQICYSLKTEGPVRLEVYNLVGQHIRTLVNETQEMGSFEIKWDGKDDKGNLMPSGIYVCKMTAGNIERSMRMTFMR